MADADREKSPQSWWERETHLLFDIHYFKSIYGDNNSVPTFLTSELLGSVVHVIMRDTARRVSLELTKSVGSICRARDSMYFRMATLTCRGNSEQHIRDEAHPHRQIHRSCTEINLHLQIGRLSLIHDKPHQNVELLVEWEGLPDKRGNETFNLQSVNYSISWQLRKLVADNYFDIICVLFSKEN